MLYFTAPPRKSNAFSEEKQMIKSTSEKFNFRSLSVRLLRTVLFLLVNISVLHIGYSQEPPWTLNPSEKPWENIQKKTSETPPYENGERPPLKPFQIKY